MKILLFMGLISINAFAQSDKINCDSLLFPEHKGFFALETMPKSVGGYDSLQSRLIYPQDAIVHDIEGKVQIRPLKLECIMSYIECTQQSLAS